MGTIYGCSCMLQCTQKIVIHYEKLRLPKPHYLATKIQKKLVYNYYATILWVLQLLYMQLSP